MPWQQPLGLAQYTEVSPASQVSGEDSNISLIKVFFSRVQDSFSSCFLGLVHHTVQAPGWGASWEGTWPQSCMGAPLALLPPRG